MRNQMVDGCNRRNGHGVGMVFSRCYFICINTRHATMVVCGTHRIFTRPFNGPGVASCERDESRTKAEVRGDGRRSHNCPREDIVSTICESGNAGVRVWSRQVLILRK